MQCRTNGEVAALCVEGELVDVQLAGADDLHVLLGRDRPIVADKQEGVDRRLVLMDPDT